MSTSRSPDPTATGASAPAPLAPPSRRAFLRTAALGTAVFAPALLASCGDDELGIISPTVPGADAGPVITLDFSRETDVLRYAAALEELEGAFYDEVVRRITSGSLTLPAAEATLIQEQQQNELAHRVFFRQALSTNLIQPTPNFAAAGNLNDRVTALTVLRNFCDTGVSAYNGSGRYLSAPNLTIAGKIVSVEARHVAAIRELLQPATAAFAGDDVVSPTTGLDLVNGLNTQNQSNPPTTTPNDVIAVAAPFTTSRLRVINF